MNIHSKSGFAFLVYILVAGVIAGVGLFVAHPKALHGESKRANTSASTTTALVDTGKKKSSEAAASIVVIAEAAANAPTSKETQFIAQEAPVALAKLEAPDAQALLEAERRKNAVLNGQVQEASRLYGIELNHTAEIQQKYQAALFAKQKSDLDLQTTAALHLGEEKTKRQLLLVVVLLVALYVYTKFTHIGIGAINEVATDIKAGKNGLDALDGVTTRLQQKLSRFLTAIKS